MKESDRLDAPLPEHSPGSPENVSRGATFTPRPTPYQVHVDVGPDGRFRQWVLLAPVPGVLEEPTLDGPELSDDEALAVARAVTEAFRSAPPVQVEFIPIDVGLARELPVPLEEIRHRLELGHTPDRIRAEVMAELANRLP